MSDKRRGRPTLAEQENQVLAFFDDLADRGHDYTELAKFLLHVGVDSAVINRAGGVVPAILNHYRFGRRYDVALLARDLVRFPPIAARIEALKREQDRTPKRASFRAR